MANGLNKMQLIGNLGRDPEIRYGQNGNAIGKLNVAIGERKKSGDEWIDHTEWVRVTCFGKTAENVGQYLAKGSKVYIEGRMQTTKYTDKEGVEKWSTDVVAHNVIFLDKPGDNGGNNGGNNGGGSQNNAGQGRGGANNKGTNAARDGGGQNDGFFDDDLPF